MDYTLCHTRICGLSSGNKREPCNSNSVYFPSIPHAKLVCSGEILHGSNTSNVYPYKNTSTSFTGYVETDLSAPDVARKKVFGINTTCLTRWGEMRQHRRTASPTVWQKAGQNTVRWLHHSQPRGGFRPLANEIAVMPSPFHSLRVEIALCSLAGCGKTPVRLCFERARLLAAPLSHVESMTALAAEGAYGA